MENVGGHVLMGLFAMMGSVLISEMIHTIASPVSRSVPENLVAPKLCVTMVGD